MSRWVMYGDNVINMDRVARIEIGSIRLDLYEIYLYSDFDDDCYFLLDGFPTLKEAKSVVKSLAFDAE